MAVVGRPAGRVRLIETSPGHELPRVRNLVPSGDRRGGQDVRHHEPRRTAMVDREHDASPVRRHARVDGAPTVAPPHAFSVEPRRALLVSGQLEQVVEEEQVLVDVARAEDGGAVRHERGPRDGGGADHQVSLVLAAADDPSALVAHQRQRPQARRPVPVVRVQHEVARVLCPGVRGDPARVLAGVARVREADPLAQPSRADGRHLRAEGAPHGVDPGPVDLLVRAARCPADGAVDPVGDDLPRVVVDHRAQRLLAVRLDDVLKKERPINVPDVALRPPAGDGRELVDGRDVAFEHVGSHPHVPHRGPQASTARLAALFQDREPFEDPVRLHLVGGVGLAEDLVDEPRDALDVIGVQDVRVLVRDQLEIPVVHVAQRRHIVRRGYVQGDRVVRQRRGRTIGAIGLVGEDDLGLRVGRRWPADRGHQATVDGLGERRDVGGNLVLGRVVVDAEVPGLDRLPQQLRVVRRARVAHVDGQREDCEDERKKTEATEQAAPV